jgi:hypothetical protein
MNERIKELAYQAEQYAYTDNVGMQCQLWRDKFQTKFAELIVRECIKIVQPEPYDGDAMTASLNAKVKQLKQHFGVK